VVPCTRKVPLQAFSSGPRPVWQKGFSVGIKIADRNAQKKAGLFGPAFGVGD